MEEERYIGSVSLIKATEREIKSGKVQEKTKHKYEREKKGARMEVHQA
jgi:hypothetical protein